MNEDNQQQEWLKNTIHFGSLVTISYIDEQGLVFYACCEGFSKSKIRLKLLEEITSKGQFNSCLFKLYPPFYNSEYTKTKKKFQERKNLEQVTSIDRREARMELPKQMKATEEECDLNAEQYEKLKGSPVYFGSTVQFLHQTSNKYLSFNPGQVSDFESDNLKANLVQEHGDESYFKFMNCFSFQQETGGYIFDDDTVYIVSNLDTQGSQELSLHASKTKEYEYNGQKCVKRELNISPEKKSFWKIQKFSKYIDDKMGYLSIYDVIWINFSEEDLNLIMQRYSKDEDKKYLKFEGCEITEKYKKFIGNYKQKNKGNSNGMLVIESQIVTEGGYVEWDKYYRLKHLTTGWYLSIDEITSQENSVPVEAPEIENQSPKSPIQIPTKDYKLIAVKDKKQASLFRFELIYSTLNSHRKDMALKYLEKDSYFRLCVQVKANAIDYWLRTQETPPNDLYIIEDQNYIGEISIPLFSSVKKDENVFKLAKANLNEVRMTSFLLSCIKTIRSSEDCLNIDLNDTEQFKNPNFQLKYKRLQVRVKRVEKCLFDLHSFLLQYFTVRTLSINEFIQNVLREQYFIETLVRILVICFPTIDSLDEFSSAEILQSSKIGLQVQALMNINQKEKGSDKLLENQIKMEFLNKKKRVCQLAYKLLQSICNQNQQNQQKCSNFLPIFALQSLYIPGAMNCIVQVISDNEELLLNLNKDQLIDGTKLTRGRDLVIKPIQIVTQLKIPPKKLIKEKSKHQRENKVADYDQYVVQYAQFAQKILVEDSNFLLSWDLLLFFAAMLNRPHSFKKKDQSTKLLSRPQSFEQKGQIVKFLRNSAIFSGQGVNINQELSYKYVLQEGQIDQVFDQEVLIRIKSDGPQLKVYRKGEEKSLIDYFHYHDLMIAKKSDQKSEINHQQEIDLVPYICDILKMYATMSNSRNYTWKKFAENFFNVESLVENLLNEKFSFELRSIICNMLNRIYVDQEPRRLIVWPELCKIVRTEGQKWSKGKKGDINYTQITEDQNTNKGVTSEDPVEVRKVQDKIQKYIKGLYHEVEHNCDLIKLNQGFGEKKQGLTKIYEKSSNIYNQHSLEMIKLFRLLMNFGKYSILIGKTEIETKQKNKDLFDNISYLVSVLEFNIMYPETRKILVEKREADIKRENSLKLGMFGFGFLEEKDILLSNLKKQIHQSGEDKAEDPSNGESFQKQVQVLSMDMNEFMYGDNNIYEVPIKLEICGVLNQYLDNKMDFYLNNLKLKFKEWTDKLNLFSLVENKTLHFNKKQDIQTIKDAFKKQIVQSLKSILPQILKTGVNSVDDNDINFKSHDDSPLGFQGLANMAGGLLGVQTEDLSEELHAINLNKIVGFSVFPSLITIFCMNQNLQLETQILQVMTRLYNQRYEFAELSSKLLLLFDEVNIKIFKKSKKFLRILAKNVDESETWVQNLQNPQHISTLVSTQLHFSQFTEFMFTTSHYNEKDELLKSTSQEIDPIRQDIMRHLKIDKLGVDMIKDSVFMVDQETDITCQDKLKEMFSVCFRFLTFYVKNNPANQLGLSQHLVALLAHIHTDLGQVPLLCEIFRNNKQICLEQINEVIDDFAKLICLNGRQVRYLEFFMIVHKVRNEYIANNQKTVLNIMIDPRFKKDIFYMLDPKQGSNKKAVTYHTFDFQERTSDQNPNYKDEPYKYHAQLIEVLASCTIGKEGLLHSENKLKALISFKYIMQLLLQSDEFTLNDEENDDDLIDDEPQEQYNPKQPGHQQIRRQFHSKQRNSLILTDVIYESWGITLLKRPLLNFVFYTYLESEKISDEIFQCLPEIIQFIKDERLRIMTIKTKTCTELFIEYFFSHFMLVINGLVKIFNQELGAQALQTGSMISQQYAIFQLELENLRLTFKTSQIMKSFNLSSRQKRLMDTFLEESIMHDDQNKENIEDQQIKVDQDELSMNIGEGPSVLSEYRRNMTEKMLSTDEIWKELWIIFLEQMLNSQQLQDEIEAEQRVFAKAIFKVEELFIKDSSVVEQINRGSIFRRLIGFLEKSSPSPDKITTFKLILKALCNYIQIQEIPDSDELDEQEREEAKQAQQVENQNFLNRNSAMHMVLTLLSDYSDPSNSDHIFNDLIYFGVQLMDGGNNEVQKSVWSYLQNFQSSEVFFMRIHNKIQDQIMDNNRIEVDDETLSFNFQQETDEMTNILRLLQLFAEGHYTVLQEYMHMQHNNYRNYDLIQDFIELLNAYMKNIKESNFDRMLQNFDTLTEFIQGPCHVNQNALLQGNFLELANNLFIVDEIVDEIEFKIEKQKQITQNQKSNQEPYEKLAFHELDDLNKKIIRPFPRWMYAKLKYKCSVTMISLLEARKDNDIVNRMIKSLNIEQLKLNISSVFYLFQQLYKEQYKPEIFNHQALTPDINDEFQLTQASFIIETGFNLFIMYSIFLEVKQENDDNLVVIQEEEKQNMSEFLRRSIIGKLLSLVQSIIVSIKDMMVDMKNHAETAILGSDKDNYELIKKELMETRQSLFKYAKIFFTEHTAHIEVLREDKNIEKTYFYIPPFCLQLDNENKKQFNQNADRVSNKAKVTSLQQQSEEIIRIMKLNYDIQILLNKVKVLAVVVDNIQLLRDFEFLLALTINIIIFIFYKKIENTDFSDPKVKQGDPSTRSFTDEDDFEYSGLINQMGVVSIVLSIIIVAFFLSRNAPLLIEKAWVGVVFIQFYQTKKKDKFNIFIYLVRVLRTIWYLLTDFFVLYYICYGAAAVLGTIVHPFFFAFHLFEVMIRFPVLLNVVKSVWQPKKYILYTALLFILIEYFFTIFAYIVFYDHYPAGGYCQSIWSCFLTTFDVTFKFDAGFGNFLLYPPAAGFSDGIIVLRWVFDNLYNLLLLIILINIVAGIIIDTFGSLREELGQYEDDLRDFCFICGFNKETIEKESSNQRGFQYHIKQEHYQWNYIFYIAYIREKDSTEYTGIESYVSDMLDSQDIQWFPLNRALCIKKDLNQGGNTDTVNKLVEINQIAKDLKEEFVGIMGELTQIKVQVD